MVRVDGLVLDSATDLPVPGAQVAIGVTTATANAAGSYAATVPLGEQPVRIDGESVGTVRLRDRTYRGDFYVHNTGCVARYGTIVDQRTRRPVVGALVSFGAPGVALTTATDYTGWFRLTLGCPGTPCVGFNTSFLSIRHPQYRSESFPVGRGICSVYREDYEITPEQEVQ